MNDTNIIAFLKDKKLGESLNLNFRRMTSPERALRARGMKLFHGVPEKKWGQLNFNITDTLEHIDGTRDLYIIDGRAFDVEGLEGMYFVRNSRILLLHDGNEQASHIYEFLERKVQYLWCLRVPLIEFELECIAKQVFI
ncbi:hypothetical protein N6H13_21365 [Paenibacillus sp. CC-CFT742]|uniref:hypothetical protein n=1 Tax=Paenibacillus xylanilyticus TaxID=248903 RepID=UPI002578B48B|nr:hypothetical protein [Paenibacillus sp. CC-CFT742]WJH27734.1 hypothetical protein N6H13_21365 [Paenibacillus sp. CC-CFT742]